MFRDKLRGHGLGRVRAIVTIGAALTFSLTAASGCGNSSKGPAPSGGELEIVLESDLSIPADIDRVRLDVTQGEHSLLHVEKDLGPGALLIPASFEVKGTGASSPVKVEALAYKGADPRVERDAITPIPVDHVGELRLALNYLCVGTAKAGPDGTVTSTCPNGMTCVQGACVTSKVPPSDVPRFVPDVGSSDASAGGCFDVQHCFASSTPVNADPASCSFTLPDGVDLSKLNVALELPEGTGGVCGPSSCWVVFDRGSDWTVSGATVTLPSGACSGDATRAGKLVVSTQCLPKTEAEPDCGDWSSITTPVSQPSSGVALSCQGPSSQPCGRCGTETRTCTNGTWSDWSSCSGEGVCEPKASQSCGTHGTQTCTDSCEWGPCGCASGELECGKVGDCSSPDDVTTCGTCGHDCTALPNVSTKGIGCKDGACSYDCAPGFADCGKGGDGCTTDLSQPATCGSCTNDCTALPHVTGATSCEAGRCAFPASSCAAGWGDCNGDSSDGCEADLSMAAHCGSCGNACTDATPLCNGSGTCAVSCDPGKTACGGTCTDVTTDENNCGACGHACASNQTCVGGQCGGVCAPSGLHCNGKQPQSCGPDGQWKDSGSPCTASQTCSAGKCGGVCGSGQAGSQSCGTCNAGTQTRTCNTDGTWGAWSACAGGANVQTDSANCGACGHACAAGIGCQAGTCSCNGATTQPCGTCNAGTQTRTCNADGSLNAWSACTGGADLQTSNKNCGVCGHVCAAGVACQAGSCPCSAGPTSQSCGTCNLGTETRTCNGDGSWSAWSACTGGADLQTQSAHCGSCTNACISGVTCQGGKCQCTPPAARTCGTCNAGTQSATCNVDGSVTWSACSGGANTQTDDANCGACGHACVAGSTCTSGVCTCSGPLSESCGNCNTGTQTRTCNSDGSMSAWSSCTGGGACAPGITQSCGGSGTQTCSTTTCQWGSCICPNGMHECNGTCVTQSIASCGPGCLNCPAPANGNATCNGFSCGIACAPGFTNCGTTCSAGACPLASGQLRLSTIATDGTNVYFTTGGTSPHYSGPVMKVPVGGGSTVSLTGIQGEATGIVVTGGNVYWATIGDPTTFGTGGVDIGAISRVSTSGGTVTVLASKRAEPSVLATNGSVLAWTEYATPNVMVMPIGGGTPSTVMTGSFTDGMSGVAVDAANVYWSINGSNIVMQMALAGGNPITLADSQQGPGSIALDGANVYWADANSIRSTPIGGGAITTLLTQAAGIGIGHLAVDGPYVYFVNSTSSGASSILRLTISSGGLTTVVSTGAPDAFALDSVNIYWTDPTAGTVNKAAKP